VPPARDLPARRLARHPRLVTLRLRLAFGLTAVVLLLAAPLAVALDALHQARLATSALGGEEVGVALLLGRSRDITAEIRGAEQRVLFVPEERKESAARMRQAALKLAQVADTLQARKLPAQVAALRNASRRLQEAIPLEVAAAASGRAGQADSIADYQVAPAVQDAALALAAAERDVRARSDFIASAVRDKVQEARLRALFLLMAGAAGATAVSVWLTRSVSQPVRELARGMEAVASGRFDHALRIAPARRDEFGGLAANFATMTHRLGELDRLRAEFVSVASHELKTPLNVILGYLALIDEGLYGPVNAEQRGVLRTVDGQARHLTRLVQRLLDVSRFRAGAGSIEARPMRLAPFLADLERAHRVLAEQRQLSFTFAAEPGLPETVAWDADRMSEVLGNLLSNAVKFTPAGGRVTLTAERAPDFATAGASQPGPAIRLSVEDTGVGIAPDQLPHVFDKFYQASNQAGASAGRQRTRAGDHEADRRGARGRDRRREHARRRDPLRADRPGRGRGGVRRAPRRRAADPWCGTRRDPAWGDGAGRHSRRPRPEGRRRGALAGGRPGRPGGRGARAAGAARRGAVRARRAPVRGAGERRTGAHVSGPPGGRTAGGRVRAGAWPALAVAAGGLLALTGDTACRRARPPARAATATAEADSAWPATLAAARSAMLGRDYRAAESTLATFSRRFAGTAPAADATYWWAVARLDPANRGADPAPAAALLDAYRAGDPPRRHALEAGLLRALLAQQDSLRLALAFERAAAASAASTAAAARAAMVPRDTLRARDEELSRARTDAAAAQAELDRVRRRLTGVRGRRP
jgi:signal transduction histidine kinase